MSNVSLRCTQNTIDLYYLVKKKVNLFTKLNFSPDPLLNSLFCMSMCFIVFLLRFFFSRWYFHLLKSVSGLLKVVGKLFLQLLNGQARCSIAIFVLLFQ